MTILEQTIKDLRADIESEREESDVFSPAIFAPKSSDAWEPTPKQIEIMAILKETPMLTDWCLRQLKGLQARIMKATLDEMYSPEELAELRREFEIEEQANNGTVQVQDES